MLVRVPRSRIGPKKKTKKKNTHQPFAPTAPEIDQVNQVNQVNARSRIDLNGNELRGRLLTHKQISPRLIEHSRQNDPFTQYANNKHVIHKVY